MIKLKRIQTKEECPFFSLQVINSSQRIEVLTLTSPYVHKAKPPAQSKSCMLHQRVELLINAIVYSASSSTVTLDIDGEIYYAMIISTNVLGAPFPV